MDAAVIINDIFKSYFSKSWFYQKIKHIISNVINTIFYIVDHMHLFFMYKNLEWNQLLLK